MDNVCSRQRSAMIRSSTRMAPTPSWRSAVPPPPGIPRSPPQRGQPVRPLKANSSGAFQGTCRNCGRWGHKAASCRTMHAVVENTANTAEVGMVDRFNWDQVLPMVSGVSGEVGVEQMKIDPPCLTQVRAVPVVETDMPLVLNVSVCQQFDSEGDVQMLLVDSGAYLHV